MKIVKSIVAICIIVTVLTTCIIIASANITSNSYVVWNIGDTAAYAETVGNGPIGVNFYVTAWIQSNSTYQRSSSINYSYGESSSIKTTTGWVDVTYPSEAPLINHGGSHGISN